MQTADRRDFLLSLLDLSEAHLRYFSPKDVMALHAAALYREWEPIEMRHLKFGLCLFAYAFLATAEPSQAGLITFSFSGTIEEVSFDTGVPTEFAVGDSFSFEFTFDPTTTDISSDPSFGFFDDALTSATINAGTWYFVSPSGTGPDVQGLQFTGAGLVLQDPTATARSTKALPLTPPDLSAFSETSLGLFFDNSTSIGAPVQRGLVQSTITSAQVAGAGVVPEPASLAIFGTGAIGLIGFGRRRKQAPSA